MSDQEVRTLRNAIEDSTKKLNGTIVQTGCDLCNNITVPIGEVKSELENITAILGKILECLEKK